MLLKILVLLMFLFVYHLLLYYIATNVSKWLKIKKKWKVVVFFFLLGYSYPLSEIYENVVWLKIIGSYWVAFIMYSLFLLPLAKLIVFLLKKKTSIQKNKINFWTGLTTSFILVVVLIIGTYNAYQPVAVNYSFEIDKTLKGSKELKIVMLSDTHFGVLSGKGHAKRLVEKVNEQNPDLVLIAGDLIDDNPIPMIEKELYKELKKVESTFGVYAVLGNHDYRRHTELFLEELEKSNITVIRDDFLELENGIILVGREDKIREDRKELKEILSDLNKNQPIILLDHQPYELEVAEENGVDLIVSGHTHKGQMFPGNLLTNQIYENHYGYLKKENLHSVVTSGYGFWGPPVRIGSRSEIAVITVRFPSSS